MPHLYMGIGKAHQQQIISRLARASTLAYTRTPLFLSLANPSDIINVASDIIQSVYQEEF